MKVETARTRTSQAWSEGQDQILLDIVHSYRGKTISGKSLEKNLNDFIPNESLNAAKRRLAVLNKPKKAPK